MRVRVTGRGSPRRVGVARAIAELAPEIAAFRMPTHGGGGYSELLAYR
jgi:hypothetical protein